MFNVTHLVQTGGLLLIALTIFSETGLLLGFILPGDTLLLSAGVYAAAGKFDVAVVIAVVAAAAIAGDNVGYHIGHRLGRRLFRKPDSILFRKEYIDRTEAFYEKYGSKTMLVAHFVPVIRAFIPVTAGAAKMPYGQFAAFDAVGDIAWTVIMTLLGYFVASHIPNIEHYIDPVLVLVVVVCLLPTLWHILRDPKIRAAISAKFKRPPKKAED
ncbi:MAG TPA: DedA family protein [Candidatus Saccharimonadales bacterium]|jgi:membrane-associated protein